MGNPFTGQLQIGEITSYEKQETKKSYAHHQSCQDNREEILNLGTLIFPWYPSWEWLDLWTLGLTLHTAGPSATVFENPPQAWAKGIINMQIWDWKLWEWRLWTSQKRWNVGRRLVTTIISPPALPFEDAPLCWPVGHRYGMGRLCWPLGPRQKLRKGKKINCWSTWSGYNKQWCGGLGIKRQGTGRKERSNEWNASTIFQASLRARLPIIECST